MKKIIKNSIKVYIGMIIGIIVIFVVSYADKTYEHIVYMDPTDLSKTCYDLNSDSTTGQKTGCMKWYIYGRDNDGNYLAILDHNTMENQAWNTEGYNGNGTNVPYEQSLVYPVVQNLTSTDTATVGSSWDISLSPRLISAYEVADIVGKNNFTNNSKWFYLDSKNQNNYPNYQGGSSYAWLFDNLGWSDGDCTSYGCNYNNTTNNAAYWTETPHGTAGAGSDVWLVHRGGRLHHDDAYGTGRGVRPVIEVLKTIFE